MSNAQRWTLLAAAMTVLSVVAAAPASARQRISAELETSQLSVVNGVAEATFRIVVKNDEPGSITGVYLVFDDGFEVAVGDVAGETSGASEATTRTFDLGDHGGTLSVALPAKLKYALDGAPVEQAMDMILKLDQ